MKLDVDGMRLVVRGSFSRLTSQQAREELRELGAQIVDALTDGPDYLIAGAEAEHVCREATALGVPILTEHALLAILGRARRRRRHERFPHSQNLRAQLDDQASPRTLPMPLPAPLAKRGVRLELRVQPTGFRTSRRFGETWGLKLSEFEQVWLGQLRLDGEPMRPTPQRDDVEHLYYCRFRADGRDYASGEQRFDGAHGFHASWLLEWLEGAHQPPPLVEDASQLTEPEAVWQRLEGGGERGRWMLKLNAELTFGHVQAFEHEELRLDLDESTWRWSHYFCPYDGI